MDDAVRAYQEQSRRLLDVAAVQYGGISADQFEAVERGLERLVDSLNDPRVGRMIAAIGTDKREEELAAILSELDEPDARWLLALIRAKFGRLEPITRETWVQAKRR
jgi:hypothetical protein